MNDENMRIEAGIIKPNLGISELKKKTCEDA